MVGDQGLRKDGRVGKPTGLSQAEPEAGLGPSGFDPSRGVGMLTCIICDRQFDSAANDPSFDAVPYEGTIFYSSGHYGSTAFDPMDRTRLEIIVCDRCLCERSGRAALVWPRPTEWHREAWKPARDSDGSPEGEDALAASSETTARAEGIAPSDAALSKVQPS